MEFITAYQQALNNKPAKVGIAGRGGKGTFDQLVRDYFASPDFLRIAPQTQTQYRGMIERFLAADNVGHRQVHEMTRQHVQASIARRANTPAAANNLLKRIGMLMRFAIDNGWRKDDPTVRIKRFAEGEHHTWTDTEIAKYEEAWPLGTRERLAFGLLIFTGQRASDVAKMAWCDVGAEGIWVVQRKTKAKLLVPLHPELRRILAIATKTDGSILQTSFNKPFSADGFKNFMADKIGRAGLPDRCVTHGLRKAAARRLAEAGCSANEIASITGHATLDEVARYTKAAEQKKLAQAAIKRLSSKADAIKIPNLSQGLGSDADISNIFNAKSGEWRSPILAEAPKTLTRHGLVQRHLSDGFTRYRGREADEQSAPWCRVKTSQGAGAADHRIPWHVFPEPPMTARGITNPHLLRRQAARTVVRKRLTSSRRCRLSDDSDFADESTWVDADPVAPAPLLTSEMLLATSAVPLAASVTLRLISLVVAPCSSTAAAMVPAISDIWLIVPVIS